MKSDTDDTDARFTTGSKKKPRHSNGSRATDGGGGGGKSREPPRPDPIRYVRLWDTTSVGGNRATATAEAEATPGTTLEEELELAAYNQRIWEKIDERKPTTFRSRTELNELRWELDRVTVLPRLLARSRARSRSMDSITDSSSSSDDDGSDSSRSNARSDNSDRNNGLGAIWWFWDRELTPDLKHDRRVAWALVRAASARSTEGRYYYDKRFLALPFQEMLWTDVNCPLRHDRDLLLSSLETEGGLHESVRVPWSSLLENDREVLLKFFERCPWSLDEADVPPRYLDDQELLLTFVRSKWLVTYRNRRLDSAAFVYRFTRELLNDGATLAELVSESDRWSRKMVKRSGIKSDQQHTLLDNLEFVLLATERMRLDGSYRRDTSPVRYERLSQRLRASSDVIRAFAVIDPEFWAGQWITSRWGSIPNSMRSTVDVDCDDSDDHLYLPFPLKERTDRDAAARLVFLRSMSTEFTGDWSIVRRVQMDRDFWTRMAERHLCPVSGWDFIPIKMKSDPTVITAWARHATRMTPRWIVWADDKASVLSDRQALLNCLPQMWKYHDDSVWTRVDQRVLDPPLCVDVLSRTEAKYVVSIYQLLPDAMRSDRAVLDALLRCGMNSVRDFSSLFRGLPPETQLQSASLFVEALRNSGDDSFSEEFHGFHGELFHIPEVIDTALARGWRPRSPVRGLHPRSSDNGPFASDSPWSKDPTFLLLMVRRHPAMAVWALVSDGVRRDKHFIRAATRSDAELWWSLPEKLRYDFDVLLGTLSGSDGGGLLLLGDLDDRCRGFDGNGFSAIHSQKLRAFAREVRRRLVLNLSLSVLMGGIRGRYPELPTSFTAPLQPSPSPLPMSVMNQGPDALDVLEGHLAGFLGAPTDPSVVAEYRRVSNALSRHGY